jgi:hypothetical protein
MGYVIIICGLIVVITIQNITHHKERQDLYNRLMCRDITDYDRHSKAPKSKEAITPLYQRIKESLDKTYAPTAKGNDDNGFNR